VHGKLAKSVYLVDRCLPRGHMRRATARDVLDRIRALGGEVVRRKGSHVRVRYGSCLTTAPDHGSRDLPRGTLRAIERDLEPGFGAAWLRDG
jgi:predicted RNA binding protein YcfA (HicA-like mRNA interferase family)